MTIQLNNNIVINESDSALTMLNSDLLFKVKALEVNIEMKMSRLP